MNKTSFNIKTISLLLILVCIIPCAAHARLISCADTLFLPAQKTSTDAFIEVDGPSATIADTTMVSAESALRIVFSSVKSAPVHYSVNESAPVLYERPIKLTKRGVNVVRIYQSGHVAASSNDTRIFKLDSDGPELGAFFSFNSVALPWTTAKQPGAPIVLPRGTSLSLMCSDKMNKVKDLVYSIDDSSERDYCKPIRLSAKGKHSIKVRATDMMGNVTLMRLICVTIVE